MTAPRPALPPKSLFQDTKLHADELARVGEFYRLCGARSAALIRMTPVDDAWLDFALRTREYTFSVSYGGLVATYTYETAHPGTHARETHRQHFFPLFLTRSAKARLLAVQ